MKLIAICQLTCVMLSSTILGVLRLVPSGSAMQGAPPSWLLILCAGAMASTLLMLIASAFPPIGLKYRANLRKNMTPYPIQVDHALALTPFLASLCAVTWLLPGVLITTVCASLAIITILWSALQMQAYIVSVGSDALQYPMLLTILGQHVMVAAGIAVVFARASVIEQFLVGCILILAIPVVTLSLVRVNAHLVARAYIRAEQRKWADRKNTQRTALATVQEEDYRHGA